MNNFDYILELLEKDDLSEEEKRSLLKFIEEDKQAKDFVITYNKIRTSLEKVGHISSDALNEYVLFKNGNKEAKTSVLTDVPRIEKHLRECSMCNTEFIELNQEYNSVDLFVGENLPTGRNNKEIIFPEDKPQIKRLFNIKTAYLRAGVITILLIGLFYAGMYVISSYTVPNIKKYASLDAKTDFYITRGRVSPEFQQSVMAIQNGDFNSAINFLNKDIHINNSDETIFYTYYILGLTYLESAETNILGLFPSYNKDKVQLGIGNLKESIKRNNSGNFPNITYDAYYFIGKANLMLNNITEVKKYLQLVVDNKGSKLEEAKEILQRLNMK